ncbi:hypothetical protein [Scytonema sp. NUACC26]|uniref:hypothetical protein n=1 Tax=Scytonema sp. NUACC26 TaxID=3140176 RepID=UPI0034DB7F41
MTNLISNAIAYISSFFKEFQVKRFMTVVLVGFLVLTTGVNTERGAQAVTKKVQQAVQQDTSDRPKTTGEWNKEARQTEDAPGKRAQRIVKESAEAVKDLGSVYPDTAKRTASDRD